MTVNYEIGRPRQDKKMRITLLVCIGKTKKRIKTELFASQTDINRQGKLKSDSVVYSKIKSKARDIELEYAKEETFITGRRMTAEEFLSKKNDGTPSFIKYADQWLERARMKGKKNYKTAIEKFKSVVGDVPFSAFSHRLLSDFEYSLRDYKRAQSQYVSAIKKIYTDAEKDYDIPPFSSFRYDVPTQKRAVQRSLDIGTIRKIFSYNGTESRALLARDCCLLSFAFCGMNSADLYEAPAIKGNILRYDRQKTKDRRYDNAHMEIDIQPQIKDVVKRYKDTQRAFTFHRRYSSAGNFNTAINKGLDVIKEKLGIKDDVTFYSFRHSWASIARNDIGVDKYTVHEALCHIDRDTAIDDIYIRKDYSGINNANKRVLDFVLSE